MTAARVPGMSRRHIRAHQENLDGFMTGARAALELAREVYVNLHGEEAAVVFWRHVIDGVERVAAAKAGRGDV